MDVFKQECKLCDDIVSDGNFRVIEEFEKSIFDIPLLKLMLEDDTQNVICTMCSSKLLAALNFKSTCLYTDNIIKPYIDYDNKKLVNLKEIYAKEMGSKQGGSVLDDWEVCRLCLQLMAGSDHKSIQEVPVDSIEIYIPEINFSVSTNPLICLKCHDALCLHSTFIRNCLDLEKKRNMNAANVGDIRLANPCIKMEEIDIKCENEENTEGVTSLHSQSGVMDTEETKILYDLEDLKETNAESTVVGYKNKESTSNTPCESNRKMKRQYSRENRVKFTTDLKARKYQCGKCLFNTRLRKNYIKHQLLHKNPSEARVFKCDECDYKSMHKGSLRTHQLRHKDPSEVRMFMCDECDYKSIRKGDLKHHQLKHKSPSEVQVYKCDECDYKSIYKLDLKQHQIRHKDPAEVKMFKCDQCYYKSVYKGNLLAHQLRHKDASEVQMFKCDKCDYKSSNKHHLKLHQLRHKDPSEVPVFKCDECDYKSIRKGNLLSHQLRHKDPSEVQMYKCDECKFITKYKSNITIHCARHKEKKYLEKAAVEMAHRSF